MNKDKLNQAIVWLLNEKYGGRLTTEAKKDITWLARGEPVDYVIGYKKFLGCKIDLRYKPLIPRDETEFWVGEAIKNLRQAVRKCHSEGFSPKNPVNFLYKYEILRFAQNDKREFSDNLPLLRCLDVFAGSGCIGIAILKHIPNSHCDFLDIDDNCLKQTRLNLKVNRIIKSRYRVIRSDAFKILTDNLKTKTNNQKLKTNYDFIFANPPYIGLSQKQKVQKSVLDFEPRQALFAKDNGLFFIKRFLQKAKDYLAENGTIHLEFGYAQKKDIEKILKQQGYQDFEFHKDQFSKWRYLKIK